MQEESKNPTDIDPSGMFSTYKAHPDGHQASFTPEIYPTAGFPVKKKENNAHEDALIIKILCIIVDGLVRIIKISVWSIAVFGSLFIAALATNTIDRAVEILNKNIGTKISISGEVDVIPEKSKTTTGLKSSIVEISNGDNTPEVIASKRRAILEAKKAAKILAEQQKAIEQSSQ